MEPPSPPASLAEANCRWYQSAAAEEEPFRPPSSLSSPPSSPPPSTSSSSSAGVEQMTGGVVAGVVVRRAGRLARVVLVHRAVVVSVGGGSIVSASLEALRRVHLIARLTLLRRREAILSRIAAIFAAVQSAGGSSSVRGSSGGGCCGRRRRRHARKVSIGGEHVGEGQRRAAVFAVASKISAAMLSLLLPLKPLVHKGQVLTGHVAGVAAVVQVVVNCAPWTGQRRGGGNSGGGGVEGRTAISTSDTCVHSICICRRRVGRSIGRRRITIHLLDRRSGRAGAVSITTAAGKEVAPVLLIHIRQALHLQRLGGLQQRPQLRVADVDLAAVHEVNDGAQVLVAHVLQYHNRVLAGIVEEQITKVGAAGAQHQLVRLQAEAVAGERHIDEALVAQQLVEDLHHVVGVVVPLQAVLLLGLLGGGCCGCCGRLT
ncbi:hypothetical protein TYRP_015574 [Tyrophagus putrescentiae]|nr:hypothetical protein TYRP_015574 [Tyrophagus putrescentiae]